MAVPPPSEGFDRALAVMAKAPRPGRVKTRLAPAFSPEEAAALSVTLLTDTIQLATTLPRVRVAVVCPRGEAPLVRPLVGDGVAVVEQLGSGLAAALTSTFEQFLAAGYRQVVAFNSDSPHVACDVLRDAFAALETADLVVGPTDDGGYYLVGTKNVHPGLFDAPPLGTAGALDALTRRAEELGLRFAQCAAAFDVDLPADVTRLAQELRGAPERARATAALLADWHRGRRFR
jgi:hypothetical protein